MSAHEVPYKFLVAPSAPARGSITTSVTESLRRAIVTLEFKPGEGIDKSAVCARLNVSRFPVSEALARLQTEGLVDILPQRGTVVSLVRIIDAAEFMMIRKALESEAVRVLASAKPPGLDSALESNLEAQRRAARSEDRTGFHSHDLAFHDLLFDALRLERVRLVIDSARANLDRARRLILDPRRLTKSFDEHKAIVAAIAAADPPRAAAAMRAHIDNVMAELLAFARQYPELFADGEAGRDYAFPFG
ncbi:MAG: GntR family transcriptional regulator [Devosia sp.]